jgi:hypothetical protein
VHLKLGETGYAYSERQLSISWNRTQSNLRVVDSLGPFDARMLTVAERREILRRLSNAVLRKESPREEVTLGDYSLTVQLEWSCGGSQRTLQLQSFHHENWNGYWRATALRHIAVPLMKRHESMK